MKIRWAVVVAPVLLAPANCHQQSFASLFWWPAARWPAVGGGEEREGGCCLSQVVDSW